MADVPREQRTARNWYWWLWLSPMVTLPSLVILIVSEFGWGLQDLICPDRSCGFYYEIPIATSILLSGLWHLILLIPSLNPRSEFIRWHGRQALLLAGVRTFVPVLLVRIGGELVGLLLSIPTLLVIWLGGTLWGQRQAIKGRCSLASWLGRELALLAPEPDPERKPKVEEDPDDLVEIIRSSRDPERRKEALAKLDSLGMVEPLDRAPSEAPVVMPMVKTPAMRSESKIAWLIVPVVILGVVLLLSQVSGAVRASSATATAEARATTTRSAVLGVTATAQALEAIAANLAAYPVVFSDGFDADSGFWTVGVEDNALLTGAMAIEDGAYRWEATANQRFYWWSTPDLDRPPIEFYLSVEATRERGSAGSHYGVLFRLIDTENFYAFLIAEDQHYKVIDLRNGEWRTIEDGVSPSIIPGSANRLSVVSSGPQFFLFINDQSVYSFEDRRLGYGEVGLIVSAVSRDYSEFSFDNFELRELPLSPESANEQRSVASLLIRRAEQHLWEGDIEEALSLFSQAQVTDPDIEISAQSWNLMCWYGSLWGYVDQVFEACELAVSRDPTNEHIRDSRGLARALTGDFAGAIEDFKYYVEHEEARATNAPSIQKRQSWIKDLQAGINPFDAATLEDLKDE